MDGWFCPPARLTQPKLEKVATAAQRLVKFISPWSKGEVKPALQLSYSLVCALVTEPRKYVPVVRPDRLQVYKVSHEDTLLTFFDTNLLSSGKKYVRYCQSSISVFF